MTKLQCLARKRNWEKCRIMGFVTDVSILTYDECSLYKEMQQLQTKLLATWDKNTKTILSTARQEIKNDITGIIQTKELDEGEGVSETLR